MCIALDDREPCNDTTSVDKITSMDKYSIQR